MLKQDPALEPSLRDIMSPHTAGDPMGRRKWLNCRLRDIQARLDGQGHGVSLPVISRLLKGHDYPLRANVKRLVGKQHPERDRQLRHIHEQRANHQAAGHAVISIDVKKKALVDNFKNASQIWGQEPKSVDMHDFPQDAVGWAVPYGIYDLQYNRGTVYVGKSADTPVFTVDNIAHWCRPELPEHFPNATNVMIEADGGGSSSYRARVWTRDLQEKVADPLGLTITVSHYPTGASKWNPIDHRLFSEISKIWAGCPLCSFDDVLHYICDTRSRLA